MGNEEELNRIDNELQMQQSKGEAIRQQMQGMQNSALEISTAIEALQNIKKVKGDTLNLTLSYAGNDGKNVQQDLTTPLYIGKAPAKKQADTPVLTRNQVGAGTAYYLACPLFGDYHRGLNFPQKLWFAGLLEAVCPAPAQALDSPAGSVELVPYAAANTTWSVLLNHGGEQLASGGPRWPRTVAPLPAYRVQLELRDAQNRVPRAVTCGGKPCRWMQKGDVIAVPVTLNKLWKVIRTEWE